MRPVLHAQCARARLRRAFPTPCEVVRERDFRLVGTRVVDVSVRGMLIEAETPMLTGEEVVLTFRGPGGKRWYDCAGTVARVLHGRRRGDVRLAVGVEFEGLGPLDQMFLCDELAKAPLSPGRRLPRFDPRRAMVYADR